MATTDIREAVAGSGDRFIYLTAALAALNGLLFGFDTGIISGAFLYINDTFTMSPLV
ncbi:MFS transporter, partial [halophilic archaeon]